MNYFNSCSCAHGKRNMSKFLAFYGSLLFVSIHFVIAKVPYICIHEKVSNEDVPIGTMSYKAMRGKRHITHEMSPLIIHTHIDNIDPNISRNVLFNIDVALRKVEKYIAQTLSVRQTFNPFLLERLNCVKRWKTGLNNGKCAQAKSGPEFCSLKLTENVIPDRYLTKLEVFNDKDDNRPISVAKDGMGARDANFILFVISRTTSWCKENGVQAYGSYCRLDSQNRPVAGIMNMCPEYFSKKLYKPSHYYNVIMHEVIHILGFSLHLYPKFKICNSEYDCQVPKKIVSTDSHNIQRLVFPDIVKNMQAHCNCSEDDFGGPLEEFTKKDNVPNDKNYTSHWHPLLMYTSIMTPSILEDDYVVMDNITLALLSSTGWYKVNFTNAETFAFGKDGGCNFGFENTCEMSNHLCSPSNSSRGCDILHYTIGKCESIVPSHKCGVYRPNLDESCVDEYQPFNGVKMRYLYHEHRCIMLQNLNNMTEPTCMLVKCGKRKGLEILANSTWVSCLNLDTVKVNNMTITCPNTDLGCAFDYFERQHNNIEKNLALSVRIYFTEPSFDDLLDSSDFKNFKGSTLIAIAKSLNIPVNYIVNATMVLFKKMYLDFSICPPKNISYEELSSLIHNTQTFLKRASFSYIFFGAKNLPVASTKFTLDPEVAVAFSDHEGFRMLIIFPIICAIFVTATFIASIFRYAASQMHRPKRETVEMEELSQKSDSQSPKSSPTLHEGKT